jgi:hypothetical protein
MLGIFSLSRILRDIYEFSKKSLFQYSYQASKTEIRKHTAGHRWLFNNDKRKKCGEWGSRTPDLLDAIEMLYQLS